VDVTDGPVCFCGSRRYHEVMSGVWLRGGHEQGISFTVAECDACRLARTLPVPDASRYERSQSCWSGSATRRDSWSERIAEELAGKASGRRMLDVGCNTGNLVEAAASKGFDAEGIDLDPSAIREGQRLGRRISAAAIEDLDGPYDVVVMNHVLEHVPDLRSFVGHAGRLLAPAGILAIRVPHYKGLIPRLMGDHWFAWAPDEHVWHFSRETLERIVRESAPLRPVEIVARGAIEPPSGGLRGLAKGTVARWADRLGRGDQIVALFAR
jgi:SAM-dependent methyltransferase